MKQQPSAIVPVKPDATTTAITKAQWCAIEAELKNRAYASIEFKLPGGELISVVKQFIAENRLGLVVGIDGKYKAIWGYPRFGEFLPLVKSIWCRKTHKPGAKAIRRISAIKGGKTFLKRKENAHLHEVVEYWVPYFNTARALITQFKKIEGIQLITELAIPEASHD